MNLRRKLQQYITLNSYVEKVSNVIPNSYKKLEYISNAASTKVITDIIPDVDDMMFEIKVQPSMGSWYILQARRTSSSGPIYGLSGSGSGQTFIFSWNGNNLNIPNLSRDITHTYLVRGTAKNGNMSIYVRDLTTNIEYSNSSTYESFEPSTESNPVCIFGNTQGGSVNVNNHLYYAKIWKAGKLVLDYVPVANSENVLGFYDTITSTFKTAEVDNSLEGGPSTTDFKDAIHNGLKEITAYGKTIQPAKDYLDTVTANGGTELAPVDYIDSATAKGKTQLRRVPSDYEELEYVTFDGTQIVDTNVICNEESRIESKWMANSSSIWVYGTGADNPRITCYCVSSGNERFGNVTVDSTGITHGVLNTVIHDKNGFYYNGTNGKPYSNVGTFTCLDTLTIGNSNGSTGTPYFNGNFYYMKIYQNSKLVLNLVPAKHKFDNAIGFYDTVNNSFIVPSTGTLIAGPGIDAPTTYARLEYLESNGQQYINTGIKPNQNTEITTIVQGLATTGQRFFSVCNGTPSSPTTPYYAVGFSNSGMFVNQYGTSNNVLSKVADTDKHTIVKSNVLIVDGININTATAETFQQDYSIYLFGANYGGSTTLLSSLRMFTFTIRENGVILQNLIPVKRCSDGVLGMYDTISGDFLLNGGNADFIAGPEIGGDPNTPLDIYCNNGKLIKTSNEANYIASNVTLGYWIKNSTGVPEASEQNFYTNMMPIKPNTSYVCYGRNKSDGTLSKYNRIAWYDSTGTWISNSTYTVDTITIATSPANAVYARFHCNPLNSGTVTQETIDSFNWIFCKGTEEVAYTPYITTSTQEILQDASGNMAVVQNLLQLDSTYQDTQEILTGALINKVGILVLDGTENWNTINNNRGYYINTNIAQILANSVVCLCSHFKYSVWPDNTTPMPDNYFGPNRNSSTGLANGNVTFKPDLTIYDTVDKWKAWLTEQYMAGTPVIMVYPLSNSTTTAINTQILKKEPVYVIQGGLDNLDVDIVSSTKTVPAPNYPLDIRCNNGVLKGIRLPYEYDELDYVENTSNSVIDTLKVPNSNTKFVLDAQVTDRVTISGNSAVMFGNTEGGWTTQSTIRMEPNIFRLRAYTSTSDTDTITSDTLRHTFVVDIKNGYSAIDNTTLATWTPGFGTATSTLKLFGGYWNNTYQFFAKMKVYSAKIYENNVLVMDLVPAKRKSDGVIGLYDTIGKFFFININPSGSNLTAGNIIPSIVGTQETLQDSSDTINIATCEALFGTTDYKDTQEILTGTVTRNINVMAFNGTENWQNISGYFNIAKTDIGSNSTVMPSNTTNIICSHFEIKTGEFSDGIGVGGSYINIKYDSLFTTLDQFKAWLADQYAKGTPVTIVYPLATATTETVSGQTLVTPPVMIKQASMSGLTVDTTQTNVTVPTPARPLDIYCNNGKLGFASIGSDYTQLEYIESTGTQYIDTGIKGNQNTKVHIKTKYYTTTTAGGSGRIFGSRDAAQVNAFAVGSASGTASTSSTVSFFFGNQSYLVTEKSIILDEWLDIIFDRTTHSINGVDYGDPYNNETFETPQTLKIFGFDNSGTMGCGLQDCSKLQLWNNGILVRDFVPAKRNSDNVIGMYDTISGTFFTNAGTGDFVAGPIVPGSQGNPETITIHSKNLFNKNGDLKTGTYHIDNGTWVDNAQFKTLDYIPGKPGVSYTLSAQSTSETGGNAFSVQAWDSTHTNWLGTIASTTAQNIQHASGISPAGTAYLSVSFAPSYRDINTLQLEESPRATIYEDYGDSLLYVKDLLSVNGYADSQELINGIVTKKLGMRIFTGEENFSASNTYVGSCYTPQTIEAIDNVPLLCTHFKGQTVPGTPAQVYQVGMCINDNTNTSFWLDNTGNNVTKLKTFLAEQYAAGTPVVVIYPLVTATTETVDAQYCGLTAGNSNVEISSEYINDLSAEVLYKKLK